jgi:hypothetical protein
VPSWTGISRNISDWSILMRMCDFTRITSVWQNVLGRSFRNVDLGTLRRWKCSNEMENRKIQGVHLETQ